jgi:nitrate/TMAO reductase-like tetraheme cytochrome c subunit
VGHDRPEFEEPKIEEPKPKRRRRLRRRWIALIVAGTVVVLSVVAAFVTAHFTSRSSFCDTCHEMEPYYASWQGSSHSAAECVDCHIPPGFVPYVETKVYSFREIWVHITNGAEAPLTVTREIPSSSCLRCHRTPADIILGNATFSHQAHGNQLCITCHVRIVHGAVNPPYYVSPGSMSSCLECHDGDTAPSECASCHTPGHEPRGECSTCHNSESWTSAALDHPFPRTGGHAGLACPDCHVARPGAALIQGTNLPRPDPACISCHGDKHTGLADCAKCHTINGWKPANFRHPGVGEHIGGGEHRLSCSSCHPSGFGAHSCTRCHSSNSGGGGDD